MDLLPDLGFDLRFVLFAASTFLAVVLLVEGLWVLWSARHGPAARRLAQRLRAVTAPAGGAGGDASAAASAETSAASGFLPGAAGQRGTSSGAPGLLERRAPGRALLRWVGLAGLPARAAGALLGAVLLAPLLGAVLVLGAGWQVLSAGLVACGTGLAPWLWVARRREQRRLRIERQFPQALDMLGRALRAGHAFQAAVRMAAEELPDPLVREFRLLFEEMNYGLPVPQALQRFAERVPLADAGYFAVAVTIQRESGGNLAEVLDKIAAIVRARLRLFGEVRTLSAEGRLSAVILTALPFGVALVVHLVNPKFLAVLWTDPAGTWLVSAALSGIVVGVLWMRALVRIRV